MSNDEEVGNPGFWRTINTEDLDKESIAKEAFVQAFVAILRDVTRQDPSGFAGVDELKRFFDAVNRGAKVTLHELTTAAFNRIRLEQGENCARSSDVSKWKPWEQREHALLSVAFAGLAYLIERGAQDGAARGRAGQRADKLLRAIDRLQPLR